MRAITVPEPGGPESLVPADATLEDLQPGEVRVQVERAGVNFWDVMQRRGDVPLPPSRIPGVEGAGRVAAIGPRVVDLVPGQLVGWSKVGGSYAEAVQGPAANFAQLPDGMSVDTAAAVLMQGTTAWYLAHGVVALQPDDAAVVFAAAGGVGQLLTQLLTDLGVRVVGVVGPVNSEQKAQVARECGAEAVAIEGDALVDDVRRHVADGAAVVFDANGGPQALRDLDMLAPRGTAVYYGTASGPLPTLDLGRLSMGSLAVRRVRGAEYLGDVDAWRRAATEVLQRAADGRLRARVDGRATLDQARSLHERIEARANIGKLLLDVS